MASKKGMVKKVVLAYSGGLDTSVIIPWLRENYGCEVIAFCGNIGQAEELEGLEEKALKSGASKVYIVDLRKEFIEDFIYPTIRAGAKYERKYLLGTSFARPILAKHQVLIADKEGADAVSHGATGKGNDQVRFELTYKAFNPHLKVIAPWREWNLRSREDELKYAHKHNIPVSHKPGKMYSTDRNIWHESHEGGILEDPEFEPTEDIFDMTTSPFDAPNVPEIVEIGFEKGYPVTLNGKKITSVKLIEQLNTIGGKHGIGRVDLVENRLVGMKSRGVYETPGGTILFAAHQELESLVLDRETLHFKDILSIKYGELVYNGLWYTPLREALDAFVDGTQKYMTGSVKLKLYKGNIIIVSRTSPYSLYRKDFATFEKEEVFNQKDAVGFITLFGLPIFVQSLAGQGVRKNVKK